MKKIVSYILILFLIIFIPTTTRAGVMDNVIKSGDAFLDSADTTITVEEDKLKVAADDIYNILLYAGIGLSVIIAAILGVQFMISSAEDKAKIKEALIPYVIGCVVVFGSFGFWKIAVTLFNSI